jgi:filamentous hemagglutinin family protein
MNAVRSIGPLLVVFPLVGAINIQAVQGQSIVPAGDGTGTDVVLEDNRFDISGGQQSGANLFHSFEKFGLNSNQIANFLSQPGIENILGRVVGGDASIINGLIQVTGGNSNLFLMNPAGIIFGAGASLNVPASFTATTATGIGIGSNWFNAAGSNNYAALTGNPNAFAFAVSQPGAIINAGNLSLQPGQNFLTLLGGTVISTGQLSAPGGNITVAAIPGESVVRINQQGLLLGLDIQPLATADTQPENWNLPIPTLPQLLTGGSGSNATGLTVKNGQVVLTGSGIQINEQTGTTIVSGTLNAANKAPGAAGGAVEVLGNKVALVEQAQIDVSGDGKGGTALIGGDYQGKGEVPNATQTYVGKDATINADAINNGNGGRAIVWADEKTSFSGSISARGGKNFGNGGFVEVSGKNSLTFEGTVDLSAAQGSFGALEIDPKNIKIVNSAGDNDGELNDGKIFKNDGNPDATFTISVEKLESISKTVANILLEATNDITIEGLSDNSLDLATTSGSTVTFKANADGIDGGSFFMNSGDTIRTQGGDLNIEAVNITAGAINTSSSEGNGGSVKFSATGSITAGNINTSALKGDNGGSVSLFTTSGNIKVENIDTKGSNFSSAGSIDILTNQGNIQVGDLTNASFTENDSGSVSLSAVGNIVAGKINVSDSVNLTATTGSITVNDIETSNANDGSVSLFSTGSITAGNIQAGYSEEDIESGLVKLKSTAGNILVETIIAGIGGVDIEAFGLFQAKSSITLNYDIQPGEKYSLNPFKPENANLLAFLNGKYGSDTKNWPVEFYDETTQTIGIKIKNFPTSILAAPNCCNDTGGNISIKYGGASGGAVTVKTNGVATLSGTQPFVVGPVTTGKIDKSSSFDFLKEDIFFVKNETYSPYQFSSDSFPAGVSGTVGAIVRGWGLNTSLYSSLQNIPFTPTTPTGDTGGTTGGVIGGTNTGSYGGSTNTGGVVGTNPGNVVAGTNPVTNGSSANTGGVVGTNPVTNGSSTNTGGVVGTTSGGIDSSGNDTAVTDQPTTDIQLIALRNDASNSRLSDSSDRVLVFDDSLKNRSNAVHANRVTRNSDGTLKLSAADTSAAVCAAQLQDPRSRNLQLRNLQLRDPRCLQEQPVASASAQDSRKVAADKLLQQGFEQYQPNKVESAVQSWQQALRIYQELKDVPGEVAARGVLGAASLVQENYRDAIALLEPFLRMEPGNGNSTGKAQALSNLGIAYKAVGNYASAIASHQQALTIMEETKDRQGEGQVLVNLGNTYEALGEYDQAIKSYQQSLTIARELKERSAEGRALGNLGAIYANLGKSQQAVQSYEQSLAIARQISDKEGQGSTLANLGSAYHVQGEFTKALDYYQQSLAIAKEISNRELQHKALGNLGIAYEDLGDYSKAIKHHQESLEIARALGNKRGEGAALNNLGHTLFVSGKLPEAEKKLRDAVEVLESLRPGLNDIQNVSVFDTQVLTYNLLQQILIAQNKAELALEISERGRARAFVELLQQRLSPEASARSQTNLNPPTIAQIKKIAKEQNATLVEYSIVPEEEFKVQGKLRGKASELFIWVVQPTGKVAFRRVDLKPLQQQNNSFEDLLANSRILRDPDIQKGETARSKLHQLLIQPIADLLPKDANSHVIFIPQGELFLLPFPALKAPNGKYLIEQHTILTAPAIEVLDLTHQQQQRVERLHTTSLDSKNVLVVGNPTMPKMPTTKVGQTPQPLAPLPGAEQEARTIAKLLNTQAIVGDKATKVEIVQQMPQARLIHLATHGLLDDIQELGVPGAIALAPSKNDNGFLTSGEIFDLKLNAELVVLSACNTGRGKITGDGVIGLSRSLISSGVPSAIVSLWAVPDEPTTLLMTEFYRTVQENPNKAQALRSAMLVTMKQHPDPLNWAAFTLIGEAQ